MKKIATFAALAAAVMMTLSSCSGSGSGSEKSSLFGSLPSEYSEFKVEKDKLNEKAKDIKTEADKAELIKKGKKLDEKWTPKLEKAATRLDGKEINIDDGAFKVTTPLSLTFDKLGKKNLEPIFKVNGSAETAENITIDKTFNPTRKVYIAGYDANGEKVFSSEIGRITGEININTLEIPAGTPVVFQTLQFNGANVNKYPEAKTLKLIYL